MDLSSCERFSHTITYLTLKEISHGKDCDVRCLSDFSRHLPSFVHTSFLILSHHSLRSQPGRVTLVHESVNHDLWALATGLVSSLDPSV